MPKLSRIEIDEEMENSAEAAFAEEQRLLDERDAKFLQERLEERLRLSAEYDPWLDDFLDEPDGSADDYVEPEPYYDDYDYI